MFTRVMRLGLAHALMCAMHTLCQMPRVADMHAQGCRRCSLP